MTGNTFGKLFKITTWGESHGKAVGVVVDGCPAGIAISEKDIQVELDRRKPGQSAVSSMRKEEDSVEILSGVFNGKTTGTPISLLIKNKDFDSEKYESIKEVFRPGHADFTFHIKYGFRDYLGGGRSSGRETASRVAAGAIAKKIISKNGVEIFAYTKQIGSIRTKDVDTDKINSKDIEKNIVRCPDNIATKKMEELILSSKKKGDSVGGIVEIIIRGCPIGLGDPVFDKLNADLAKALMSIGSVKGIEFGKGFEAAALLGSENNDEMSKNGFFTNNAGGILGGISTGEDIIIRIAVKPTPSILKEQRTVTASGKEAKIIVEGRHDPCIVPRIIPVAESMCAIVIADKLLIQKASKI